MSIDGLQELTKPLQSRIRRRVLGPRHTDLHLRENNTFSTTFQTKISLETREHYINPTNKK